MTEQRRIHAARPPAGAEREAGTEELIEHLRSTVESLDEIVGALERRAAVAPAEEAREAEIAELGRKLAAVEADRDKLVSRLVEVEKQAGRVMSLYVATYQLHSTLDPREVEAAIAEIAVDLLGAERFVLLLRADDQSECRVALATGLGEGIGSQFAGQRYSGGDPMVDATLADGQLRIKPEPGSEAIAAVPFRIEDGVVGCLVILKVLNHKATPLSEERELLDLLAAHAASALLAATAYSTATRKLRTLQGLLSLLERI